MKEIVVKDIIKSTKDCSIVTLGIPQEEKQNYQFSAGQYLTLEADINGESVRRSYSLCSSPNDEEWKVGIKQIPDGKFSTYANEVLRKGDTLRVGLPEGKFCIPIDANSDRHYVFVAAGSGITPIVSLIKTHLEEEPQSSIQLFYANKTVSSIILKEELEGLKNVYMGRLEITYFLTRQSRSIPLLDGRVNKEKLEKLAQNGLLDLQHTDHFFACGPQQMVFDFKEFLFDQGVSEDRVHYELFHTSGPSQEQLSRIESTKNGESSRIEIKENDKTMSFDLEIGSNNILDAALANDADLPFACKGGVCCTCRAKVIEGEVEMLLSYGLEQDEIDAGYVLTCQTFPMSEKVVLDFDA